MDYSRFIPDEQPKRKIILITIILSAVLVGLIVFFAILKTGKRTETAVETNTQPAGEFVLEKSTEDKAKEVEKSKETEKKTEKTEKATTSTEKTVATTSNLPQTGPTELWLTAIFAGISIYLLSKQLQTR